MSYEIFAIIIAFMAGLTVIDKLDNRQLRRI